MVIQDLNTRLGNCSSAMGYCSYCNPTQRRKGHCTVIAETQEAVRNNLREAPWKRPNTRGPQAGDPVRSEDKWEDKHMGSSSSTHPTPDFKRIPDHSKPRVAGRNGVGERLLNTVWWAQEEAMPGPQFFTIPFMENHLAK